MFVRHNTASIRHHQEVWLQCLTHTHTHGQRQSSHVQNSKYTKHYINIITSKMMGKTLKHVNLFPYSTCVLSLPGRNEVACSGGDATEDVSVASCEAVPESLSPMSMSPGTVSNNNNNNNNICDWLWEKGHIRAYFQNRVIGTAM